MLPTGVNVELRIGLQFVGQFACNQPRVPSFGVFVDDAISLATAGNARLTISQNDVQRLAASLAVKRHSEWGALMAVHTSYLSCGKAGKAPKFAPVREPSGEPRLIAHGARYPAAHRAS